MTDRYGLFGHPVKHSWSPFIHGLFAKQTDQDMEYRLYDVEPDKFKQKLNQFFEYGGLGLNITVPYKSIAYEIAEDLSARAQSAGAVNTISVNEEGRLCGDNTDGAGLARDLSNNLNLDLSGKRILILGAGGAVRGVIDPLLEFEPGILTIANRTPGRAEELVKRSGRDEGIEACSFDELDGRIFDLIINATSASLQGRMPDVPKAIITRDTTCYDLSYSRQATPFTDWAQLNGASTVVKGWGMLAEQAAESFFIWRGIRPDIQQVLMAISN